MKGMTCYHLIMIMANLIMLTSSISPTGAIPTTEFGMNIDERRTETREFNEPPQSVSGKESQTNTGKTKKHFCRSSCPNAQATSLTSPVNSPCRILLQKISGNQKVFHKTLKYCSKCPCSPVFEQSRLVESPKSSLVVLQTAESVRTSTLTSDSRNSNSASRNRFIFPDGDSQSSRYSQKYNPNSKSSNSGFVPVPGPYGFKPSTKTFPRSGQYRSETYEDITDGDYQETVYDEDDDVLGSGHIEILKGGVFPYEDSNSLGSGGHRSSYSSDYYIPKDTKTVDQALNFRFPYSFQEVLPTEKKSVRTPVTDRRGVLSHLIAVSSDLDAED